MTVFALPPSLIPVRQRWQEERQDIEFRSVFGSQILQPVPPVWATELEFEDRADWRAGDIKALWMQLAGGNQLEAYDMARPAPQGTLRGTLTLAADVPQGATSMQLVRANDNLLTFPEAFDNAAWTKGSTVISPNSVSAPDGTLTADTFSPDPAVSVSTPRYIQQSYNTANQGQYSFDLRVKLGTLASNGVALAVIDSTNSNNFRANFNLFGTSAPAVNTTGTWTAGSSKFEPLADGWCNLGISGVINTAISQVRAQVYLHSYSGQLNTIGSVHLWGAKMKMGAMTDYGFGLTLLAGDLLGIGSGSKQQVVMVTQDATSTGQGNITVNFEHPLRNGFAAGQAVTWDKPKALFRLRQNRPGWDYERSRAKNLKLDLVESVYP